jgi:Protein of unknwon function (DUF3310)
MTCIRPKECKCTGMDVYLCVYWKLFCPHGAPIASSCVQCDVESEAIAAKIAEEYVQMSPEEMFDPVNHPKHYTSHPSGIECIQVTEHMGFNLGNAFKYIWRADLKLAAVEDLKKARWYLDREIAKRETAKKVA